MRLPDRTTMPLYITACPSCRTPTRFGDSDATVTCGLCGATVTRVEVPQPFAFPPREDDGGAVRRLVLRLGLVMVAIGLLSLALARRHAQAPREPAAPPSATPLPSAYSAPPVATVAPTPEGAVAWEPAARAPVLVPINGDGVEDIVGFFRVWDGRSAWMVHAGAFDGATLAPLWTSEPVDPQIVKRPGAFPLAVVAGARLVVADTSQTLRVFDLASGAKQTTLALQGAVLDLCHAPDRPTHVWVAVAGGADAAIDLDTGKASLAPRPAWCPVPVYRPGPVPRAPRMATPQQAALVARKAAEVEACGQAFANALYAAAACRVPASTGADDGFVPRYELSDGAAVVALGVKDGRPCVVSRSGAAAWVRPLAANDLQPVAAAPAVADLVAGRLYVVVDKAYADARLVAIDARTGDVAWDVPVEGSLAGPDEVGAGDARGLVATAARVYVIRAGGALDVVDAASGHKVGSIGKK